MKSAIVKEYEVLYGDPNEETQVLVCLRCFEPISEAVVDGRLFEALKKLHNNVWCPEK